MSKWPITNHHYCKNKGRRSHAPITRSTQYVMLLLQPTESQEEGRDFPSFPISCVEGFGHHHTVIHKSPLLTVLYNITDLFLHGVYINLTCLNVMCNPLLYFQCFLPEAIVYLSMACPAYISSSNLRPAQRTTYLWLTHATICWTCLSTAAKKPSGKDSIKP